MTRSAVDRVNRTPEMSKAQGAPGVDGEVRDVTRGDAIAATLVAAIAFGVYLRTLFPGLGGGGDVAKFQYVGSVLGTPHPPGYPLYILVSFCFAQTPLGSLAWRMNMMSAFFAVVAVALCYAILVRLGCRRMVAVAAALALAFDRYLWSKAVYAEVYSLTAALVAGIVFFAVRWQATRRDRDLYVVIAVFALSLGNHLTIATILPGLLAYVLITDHRTVRFRVGAVSAAIVFLGLAQYGFIILRTLQNAPYVEARATNLRELLDVIRASRFSYQMFAFSPSELLMERVPMLWRTCVREFGAIGIMVVGLGLGTLIVRRIKVGVLLVLAAAGIMFLTINVAADTEGFLVPAFVMLWIIAGLGLETVWRLAAGIGRSGAAVGIAAALALPVVQLARNYRANDHHLRTYETRYFQALFDRLENRAAIVRETYAVDQLVLYKLVGERAAGERTIELLSKEPEGVRQHARAGSAVYAFTEGRSALERSGFSFEPVQLHAPGGETDGSALIDMSPLPFFRLVRAAACRDVGNAGWQDISNDVREGRVLARIDNYRAFDATLVLYTGSASTHAGEPLLAASHGPRTPIMSVDTFRGGDASLNAALQRDGVSGGDRLRQLGVIRRIELRVNDLGQSSWSALDLRDRPAVTLVRATVDLNNPRRASVCAWSGRDFFSHALLEQVPVGAEGDAWFGRGWHGSERGHEGRQFRWTAEREAEVLVPLARTGSIAVRLRAQPFLYPGGPKPLVSLTVNALKLPARSMADDVSVYEWIVPETAWSAGFNRFTIDSSTLASPAAVGVSGDSRTLGVAVTELSFELQTPRSSQ